MDRTSAGFSDGVEACHASWLGRDFQPEVAEYMREGAPGLIELGTRCVLVQPGPHGGEVFELRQTPEAAPEPAGGALLEQHATCVILEQQHEGLPSGECLLRLGFRKAAFLATFVGEAFGLEGAASAVWTAAAAECRARSIIAWV